MPEQLDGWLRTLLLKLRHIDIINKNGDGLVRSCSEEGFSFFIELGFDGELSFFRFCFS
jgi:hypothetical protein